MVQKATIKQISNKIIGKPQLHFKDKIDNSHLPFIPKLRLKSNAITELPGTNLNFSKIVL